MLSFRQSNFPIGLDISDTSLKLVQLRKKTNKIKIQAMGRVELPIGTIEKGEIKNQRVFLESLEKLIAKPKFGNITTNEIVACLPESKTYIELIKIAKSSNQIENVIETEMEKYFPISANELFYDWQIFSEDKNNYSVLIGAAEKAVVTQYIAIFNKAKLSTVALEIESVAICRALLTEESPNFKIKQFKNYLIIDIGYNRTNLIAYSGNAIVFSVSIPVSGREITKKIADILEISEEQAEKAKIICGLDETIAKGIIKKILANTLDVVNKRIESALEFYNNNYSSLGPINEIILSGGGSNIKDLDKIIAENIKIETKNGDIFTHLDREFSDSFSKNLIETHDLKLDNIKGLDDKKLSIKQSTSSGYATAIGLSLRNIFIANK
ncbi:type IV pilus assembly protein PilM [Candidatus Parcubacteria bacterium]|nr:type IV pilus assembly protein PilM [Patescibacteria group bacterium]MBU4309068.1 type IV pilus assembly protein PilM [Patescibacteria group bacterium]MBU4432445.1 type IV pilus assembly protein PilM [Patescibacteria group bacterium]MBU4577429.1 type IV pilus assembly protein PilM [Patescibacteria group bacterium]MCG2697117.1 type IV pilus assembly protein PilM [Candidatus Parcubacteria bacterium]